MGKLGTHDMLSNHGDGEIKKNWVVNSNENRGFVVVIRARRDREG